MERPLLWVLPTRATEEERAGAGWDRPIVNAAATGLDMRGRPLRDLRISVTDRCNFRCSYCMPREVFDHNHQFVPYRELLRFEEIARLAGAFVQLGVRKLRLTGGEPLMRKDLPALVAMLAELRTPEGKPLDIALTTNGSRVEHKAAALKQAGLQRLTVSLDALEPALFQQLSDSKVSVDAVLRGIETAARAGLAPIKINMVVRRGLNEHEIVPLARHFRGTGHILRFIEYMDVGTSNGWQAQEVMTGQEILDTLAEHFELERRPPNHPGEVAEGWRYVDGQGEIGVITAISQAFCGECNRARLSPEGQLFLCLFAARGHDLREMLRSGASDTELAQAIRTIWQNRDDAYSERRQQQQGQTHRIEMSYIGG